MKSVRPPLVIVSSKAPTGITGCWPRQNSPRDHLEFFIERLLYQNNVEMEVTS